MQEIEPEGSNNGSAEDHELEATGATDLKPLGDLQKGSIDIVGKQINYRTRAFITLAYENWIKIKHEDFFELSSTRACSHRLELLE